MDTLYFWALLRAFFNISSQNKSLSEVLLFGVELSHFLRHANTNHAEIFLLSFAIYIDLSK